MRLDHIVQLHLRAVTAPNASLKVAQRRIHAGEIQIDGVVTRLPKQQIIPGVEHVSLIDGTPILDVKGYADFVDQFTATGSVTLQVE